MKASQLSVPSGIVAASLLAVILGLTGCTSSSSSPTASPAAKSTTSPSTTSSATTVPATNPAPVTTSTTQAAPTTQATSNPDTSASTMNFSQIAKGDYSSLAGEWKNEEGMSFTISGNSVSGLAIERATADHPLNALTLSSFSLNSADSNVGDLLTTPPITGGSQILYLAPAGISVNTGDQVPDGTDHSRDRIMMLGSDASDPLHSFRGPSDKDSGVSVVYYRA